MGRKSGRKRRKGTNGDVNDTKKKLVCRNSPRSPNKDCGVELSGLGNGPTIPTLLELQRMVDPHILFLCETKLNQQRL
jgi:hypothetical protein